MPVNEYLINRPAWVDLASSDPEGSRGFYARLFGWDIQVSEDPQYGGYAIAEDAGVGVAGIGPKQDPNAPTAWSLYIGTDDANALAQRVADNGGKVVMAPFDVGDQGRMAVFQDPSGGFISTWQASGMRGFVAHQPGAFDWGELNARGVENVLPFYEKVFGWQVKTGPMDPDNPSSPPYHEFQLEGESILGAWEMNPMVPANVPSYWQVYFKVDDVDQAFELAKQLGATEMVAPQDMPDGRFAIMMDPQGASFGLLNFQALEG
jgi:predicted enzyme related to lactoylglutathione lyase